MEIEQQEKNRLETATDAIAASINKHLQHLQQLIKETKTLISDHFDKHPDLKAQRQLLTTIPGIGEQTAAILLAEMGNFDAYDNARQVAEEGWINSTRAF